MNAWFPQIIRVYDPLPIIRQVSGHRPHLWFNLTSTDSAISVCRDLEHYSKQKQPRSLMMGLTVV